MFTKFSPQLVALLTIIVAYIENDSLEVVKTCCQDFF